MMMMKAPPDQLQLAQLHSNSIVVALKNTIYSSDGNTSLNPSKGALEYTSAAMIPIILTVGTFTTPSVGQKGMNLGTVIDSEVRSPFEHVGSHRLIVLAGGAVIY